MVQIQVEQIKFDQPLTDKEEYWGKLNQKPGSFIVTLLDMLKFNAAGFFIVSREMEEVKHIINSFSDDEFSFQDWLDDFKKHLKSIRNNCKGIDLKFSILFIDTIEDAINDDSQNHFTRENVIKWIDTLHHRISDELYSSVFFQLSDGKREYYENPKENFGQQVIDKFPSAIFDIEEAGKCLALSRGTACVFHLNRILEIGLRALGKSLNDPNLDQQKNPNWGAILRKCDDELKKPIAQRSEQWQKDNQFFSNATANLRAVKDAWRNPTMHVEIKYTDEEALDVFNASRSFMRHLATKLKE